MHHRKHRKATHFAAALDAEESVVDARVLDINEDGAKLNAIGYLGPDTRGMMLVRGQRFSGTVRWKDHDVVGFEFDTPLPRTVLALVARDAKAGKMKQRFLMGSQRLGLEDKAPNA